MMQASEKPKGISFGKFGGAFAASVTLVYCIFAAFIAIVAGFTATSNYFNSSGMAFFTDPEIKDEVKSFAVMACWMVVLLVVNLIILQGFYGWKLLLSTYLSAELDSNSINTAITWTKEHLDFQLKIIFAETISSIVCCALIHFGDPDNVFLPLVILAWNIFSKVLIGRILCAVVVLFYLMEQQRTALLSSAAATPLDLGECELGRTFPIGISGEKMYNQDFNSKNEKK